MCNGKVVSVHFLHVGQVLAFEGVQFQGRRSSSLVNRMAVGHAFQYVLEVGERLDVIKLGSG